MASSAGGTVGNAYDFEVPTSALGTAGEQEAELLHNLGCDAIREEMYDDAVDSFSKALEIRTRLFGEMAPECVRTYYKLGCALLYKVQSESEAVVDSNAGKGASSSAEGSKLPDNEDDSEDEEDGKNEVEGMTAYEEAIDEEEGDLELAWKVLDIARVIHAKDAKRSLAEVDVVIALADISLEREHFQLCFEDYNAALVALENLVEADNRRIAELCFKISVAKQLDQKPHEALDFCKRAISVCERRIERLNRELPTGTVSEPNKGLEVVSERVVEIVSDGGNVAQLNDLKLTLEADLKQEVEDVEKKVSSENVTESVGDADAKDVEKKVNSENATDSVGDDDAKDVEVSPEEEFKAEVNELEELLLDLREKAEELQQMAVAPSLLEALKASNPDAADLMKQVFRATMGMGAEPGGASEPVGNGGSSTTQGGSSSAAPVTNLGVMGRGVKRATLTPILDEQSSDVQPKKRTTEDLLKGGSSGETQIGFNGHS